MSSEFQSGSELLITENCLPLTNEVTVNLVLKVVISGKYKNLNKITKI